LSGRSKPSIKKLGTVDCDMVETTPIVFQDRLYLFEYVRPNYWQNKTENSYFRFIDVEADKPISAFAWAYHLGSAYVEDDVVFVYGVERWGGSEIRVFWSRDLKEWSSKPALKLPGWGIYNNSVCMGRDGYVMAIEIGEPKEVVGVRYTIYFAESEDLINWRLGPLDHIYSKDRYTACPALRFLNGYYYMIYLEAKPGPRYEPHIIRSRDLIHWESSPYNPVMSPSEEDKKIANPNLSDEQRRRIYEAVNINNSDVDLCEFRGETIIYYSWGNQQGTEFLAKAIHRGSMKDFLQGFFE